MSIRMFKIPVAGGEKDETLLNQFLDSHGLIAVHREFVADGQSSFWSFCVEYQKDGDKAKKTEPRASVDYRQVLEETEFQLFSRLRELRKKLAESEGVPPYRVCNNEQLARIVQHRVRDLKALAAIEGFGAGRVEKYGESLLQETQHFWKQSDETNRKSV